MEEAIPQVYPHARGIAYADDGVVGHADRQGLEHCQELRKMGLAHMGWSLNDAKCSSRHTWTGEQPGLAFLGFDIRQYGVGKPQAGTGPGGYGRLEHLPGITLRHGARWRHPRTSTAWVIRRSWHRGGARVTFATSATDAEAAALRAHREVTMTRHGKVQGNRSPYEGDWGDGSTRPGRQPSVSARPARLRKPPRGRWRYGGLFFPHADRIEVAHSNGNHRDMRFTNLQALHGHCHDAKTQAQGDSLPPGLRDKHQDTEERRARKRARSDLEQRQAERSVCRL